MNCPHCKRDFDWAVGITKGGGRIPPMFPVICALCGNLSLMMMPNLVVAFTEEQIEALKKSAVWEVLGPAQEEVRGQIRARKAHHN